MARLFDMYQATNTPDVYSEVKSIRQEGAVNTKATRDSAFGMLKKSNIGKLQAEYRSGDGRFDGIIDPDKRFQVYYDALKALDANAAQDAAKVYGEERQRRINREVADAYKGGATGNAELDALTAQIDALTADITATEAAEQQASVEQDRVDAELGAQATANAPSDIDPATSTLANMYRGR